MFGGNVIRAVWILDYLLSLIAIKLIKKSIKAVGKTPIFSLWAQ
jgi:hypothetical protein